MKNKLLILATLVSVVMAIMVTVLTSSARYDNISKLFTDVETLANNESGSVLTCRCSLVSSRNCAVNNWGEKCLEAVNARCWEYNKNCN